MSQENVEIVRRIYEASARDDTAGVLALYDAEIEYDFSESPFREVVDHTIYRGYAGLRQFFRERREVWVAARDCCEELLEVGGQVVSVVLSTGRGRASGAGPSLRHYGVWTVRDGKVVRVAWFRSRADALEAAGLRE